MVEKIIRCAENECCGFLNLNETFYLMCGCTSRMPAHVCNICGRLHHPSGKGVFNKSGQKAFIIEGKLTHKAA